MKQISNVFDKEFKAMIIVIYTGAERRMEKLGDIFNKEIENIKKNHAELKNTITELKNPIEKGALVAQLVVCLWLKS